MTLRFPLNLPTSPYIPFLWDKQIYMEVVLKILYSVASNNTWALLSTIVTQLIQNASCSVMQN